MPHVRNFTAGLADYRSWATDPRPRIGLGIPYFDTRTNGGLARSEVCMIQAFSSVGKTSLGLHAIRSNPTVPTLFFSLEMSWRMVVARLVAAEVGMTTSEIEYTTKSTGQLPPQAQGVADRFRNLYCDDTPSITLKDAHVSFERATEALGEPPRLVVFDFLELIGGTGLMEASQAVDKASRKIRDWCRETDASVVVLHQVGKGDGGADPLDLGSGRFGGYAPMDYVLGAFAPRLRKGISSSDFEMVKEQLVLQLLKSRAGEAHPTGVRHRLDSRTLRLSEWNTIPPIPYRPAPLEGDF